MSGHQHAPAALYTSGKTRYPFWTPVYDNVNLGLTVSSQWDLRHCMGYVELSREVLRRTWNEAAMAHGIFLGTVSSVHMLPWRSLTLRHMSACVHPFSRRLTTSNFSSKLIVFHRFSTWIALGDECLCFSLVLVTKAMLLKGELHQQSDYITDPYTWLMACSDVTFC